MYEFANVGSAGSNPPECILALLGTFSGFTNDSGKRKKSMSSQIWMKNDKFEKLQQQGGMPNLMRDKMKASPDGEKNRHLLC